MSPFRSRPICVTCGQRLPAAARRCPWCRTFIILSMAARRPVLSLRGEGGGR